MSLKKALEKLHTSLTMAKINHALIGGFALALHGLNRATGDIDILVDVQDSALLTKTLTGQGYQLTVDTGEVLHFVGEARVDVLLAKRPPTRLMLSRAKISPFLNIAYLGAEDLIGLKIQAYCNDRRRELQDKADIQYLIERPDLDISKIRQYAELFDEWHVIEKLKK